MVHNPPPVTSTHENENQDIVKHHDSVRRLDNYQNSQNKQPVHHYQALRSKDRSRPLSNEKLPPPQIVHFNNDLSDKSKTPKEQNDDTSRGGRTPGDSTMTLLKSTERPSRMSEQYH